MRNQDSFHGKIELDINKILTQLRLDPQKLDDGKNIPSKPDSLYNSFSKKHQKS
ncbi:hypothetical protein [Paenibacillus xerothermodurans]|uniref:hypothetical protein n=1 Tax=Paenibacillus xerothermodurans TaxID=1977292 RepID=UPI001403D0BF|nr:hypothetical protein [Paenibacillus xerothermodurans]